MSGIGHMQFGADSNTHGDATNMAASSIIAAFLAKNSCEFQRLSELRKKGWENPQGDAYFRKQRHNADKGDPSTA
ncbi:hypothetical protein N3K66_007169 [Trichothecium roseum]|uniref:Uncharacterized protein n=1 Tax=Trichothecium roseum TaxID=47278 RepID=A0ACC0UT98_9HYPO|nr:hypothetical protein N3K66_007169 [Trichothecium roseum]